MRCVDTSPDFPDDCLSQLRLEKLDDAVACDQVKGVSGLEVFVKKQVPHFFLVVYSTQELLGIVDDNLLGMAAPDTLHMEVLCDDL
jgi:CDP-diacylglycerol pyrophosphatase